MIYLLLAILTSFINAMIVKINENEGEDSRVVVAVNYLVAAGLGWAFALREGIPSISPVTLALGVGGGILWPGGFYLFIWGVKRYGVALSGSVFRLSLVVPVLFALLFLGEQLHLLTGLGLVLTFGAFFLLSPLKTVDTHRLDFGALWYFPTLVLWMGITNLWVNLFNHLGNPDEYLLFLTLVFTCSIPVAWGVVWLEKRPVKRITVMRGLALGIPNYLNSFFLLLSLRSALFADHSAVVYTLYSAIGVTVIFVAGAVFWRERVTRGNVAGVLLAIAAITLLNWR